MPKMKTKSTLKRRFSETANGLVKTGRSGHNHFLRKRSRRANVAGRKASYLNEAHQDQVKKLAPYGLKK
ncbi:MAG: 50S ribosomal protein L35 [Rickettsiales bacterium]|jgi:large subunit ribosomal protein L35|nr:50S ribosomal protein L35 [Rickettsiales bacterium]